MSKDYLSVEPDFPDASYRDDLGAALARIKALEPKVKPTANLPEKGDLFRRVHELFISQPERWQPVRIKWQCADFYDDRDGWVMDMPVEFGQRTLGFYRTGFFWIRIGEVEKREDGLYRVNKKIWVYIFCPSFRRTIRKHKNWRLLKNLEEDEQQ